LFILAKLIHNKRLVVKLFITLATISCMARPRKDERERKSVDLRIPLSESQKELLVEAARAAGVDTATWARPILIQAANDRLNMDNDPLGRKSQNN
jgi:hypothetical protein